MWSCLRNTPFSVLYGGNLVKFDIWQTDVPYMWLVRVFLECMILHMLPEYKLN